MGNSDIDGVSVGDKLGLPVTVGTLELDGSLDGTADGFVDGIWDGCPLVDG